MFISTTKKSPFYQLTYEVNDKRTTVSTKTKNLQEAYKFMAHFSHTDKSKHHESTKFNQQIKSILLSKFKDEYIDYVQPTKSKSYIKSIKLSFRMLIQFTGNIQLNWIYVR